MTDEFVPHEVEYEEAGGRVSGANYQLRGTIAPRQIPITTLFRGYLEYRERMNKILYERKENRT